jgi:cbb3-type cytochrome oxidase subunit 1
LKEEGMKSHASVGVACLKIACVCLMLGLLLGLFMAVRQDFTLMSVHAHLGLLGWASLAIAGIVYLVLPRCAATRLARVHFWLHNIGLPIMSVALTIAFILGDARLEPVIAVGSTMVIAGLLVFTVNVFRNARASDSVQKLQPAIES